MLHTLHEQGTQVCIYISSSMATILHENHVNGFHGAMLEGTASDPGSPHPSMHMHKTVIFPLKPIKPLSISSHSSQTIWRLIDIGKS